MRLIIYAFGFLMTAMNLNSIAQDTQRTIYGKVISFEESFPLKDVSLSFKDGKPLTRTKADGTFTLQVPANEKIIWIRQEGYEIQQVPLTGSGEYNIVLNRK